MDLARKIVVIALSGILFAVMVGMVIVTFFCGDDPLTLTHNIIVVFVILGILILFDSIESLSIGNAFKLRTKVKEKEKEIDRLHGENAELRNQFAAIIRTSFNNQTSNQVFIGENAKSFVVQKAGEEDLEKEPEPIAEAMENRSENRPRSNMLTFNRVKMSRLLCEQILQKFVLANQIEEQELQKEMKITGVFGDTDPIVDKGVAFDAYLKRPIDELFIEVSALNNMHSLLDYKFYFMISRVYHYVRANQVKAKMLLLVPRYEREYIDSGSEWLRYVDPDHTLERLREMYRPAIRNNLLEIVEIKVSRKELEKLQKECAIKREE